MDVSHILDPLNDAQTDAVTAPVACTRPGGAGSGKTRASSPYGVSPCDRRGDARSILAVTFTNKAAGEMRGRTEAMLNRPIGGMWVGTFHGLAHRLLRAHWREAGLAEGFQIIDSEDQLRAVRVIRELELTRRVGSRGRPKALSTRAKKTAIELATSTRAAIITMRRCSKSTPRTRRCVNAVAL